MTKRKNSRESFNKVSAGPAGALEEAVKKNAVETVQALLESGEKADQKDRFGTDLILHTLRQEDTTLAQLFITYGYDVNKRSNGGLTPLMQVACRGTPGMAQMLLDNGAEIDAESNIGQTALMYTAIQNNIAVAEFLISREASFDICNRDGKTVEDIAGKRRRTEILAILKEAAEARRIAFKIARAEDLQRSQLLLYASAATYTIRRRPAP